MIRQKWSQLRSRYPKEVKLFIMASMINATGSAFMWPLITIYVHNILHRSYGEAGLVLLLQSLAGVGGQIVGGTLYHRLGAKLLIVGSLFLTSITQFLLIFANWPAYVALMMVLGFLLHVTMPAINAFIGFQWKDKRKELFNVIYVSNNVGMAVGTSLSGVIATISFSLTFFINGLSSLFFAVYFSMLMKKIALHREKEEELSLHSPMSGRLPDPSMQAKHLLLDFKVYLFMALGSMFLWFSTTQWNSGIAPYFDDTGLGIAKYSFLWTINGIIILAGQPVTHLIKKTIARTLTSQLVVSAVAYTIGFAFILFYHEHFYQFAIGMIITTLGEMLVAPAIPSFITEYTGEAAPFYLGVVGAFSSLGRLLGPYVFGNMYDWWGAYPIFAYAVGIALVSMICFMIHNVFNRERVRLTEKQVSKIRPAGQIN